MINVQRSQKIHYLLSIFLAFAVHGIVCSVLNTLKNTNANELSNLREVIKMHLQIESAVKNSFEFDLMSHTSR